MPVIHLCIHQILTLPGHSLAIAKPDYAAAEILHSMLHIFRNVDKAGVFGPEVRSIAHDVFFQFKVKSGFI
jgi:hypothetical protein